MYDAFSNYYTVSNGGVSGLVALNKLPSAITKLSALLAKNEPPIFNWAFGTKIMPLGLRKNKLAVPLARIKPPIYSHFNCD